MTAMNRGVFKGNPVQRRIILTGLALTASILLWRSFRRPAPTAANAQIAIGPTLTAPIGPMQTYHLGHSLVGRDVPAMLAQVAGHEYHSQLGWGASLGDHWSGQVAGFAAENAHPAHRPAHEALTSGDYAAVVFTEMVELRDAIRHHDSATRLADWATLARQARPDVRLYLYETWHRLDDPAGWLERIDTDLPALWEAKILRPAMQRAGDLYLIPAGQVLAAATRMAEAGKLPSVSTRRAFFADDIHLNDLGNWLVAMTHYAVMYHRSPLGLPTQLTRADGTPATPPLPETAHFLQELVWKVVTGYPASGVTKV